LGDRKYKPSAVTLETALAIGGDGRNTPSENPVPTEDEILAAPPVLDHPTLTMITGPQAGSVFRLARATVVGRALDCQIVVDLPGVSRRHASIAQVGDQEFEIEDLGSRNGTTVRGARVGRTRLADGDRIGIGSGVIFRFALADEIEASLLKRQYESSILDGLTGAANRRHLDDRLASEVAYAKRQGIDLCLLLLDVDHFKRVNDRRGHPAGDHVLRELVAIVKRALRIEDIFARYGGEEFAILSRSTDRAHGLLLADRVRQLVQSTRFEHDGQPIEITVSVGVASLVDCGDARTNEKLIALADEALYRAKAAGRNCCRASNGPT
jgi:diguanylate cyclase (GGDEF)-like protein